MQLSKDESKYEKLGVKIIVIAGQKKQSALRWLAKNPLPFPLLIDEDRSVIKAFDVYNRISFDAFRLAHPSLFIVDKNGEVYFSFVSSNQFDRPTDDLVFEQVEQLID